MIQLAHQRGDLGIALGVWRVVDVAGIIGITRCAGLGGASVGGKPVTEHKFVVTGKEFLLGAAAQQGCQCAADHGKGQQTDDMVYVFHDFLQNLFLRNTAFFQFTRERAL